MIRPSCDSPANSLWHIDFLFPGRWKVHALQVTLPEASVRQARPQVQEGGGPTWVPAAGRSREQLKGQPNPDRVTKRVVRRIVRTVIRLDLCRRVCLLMQDVQADGLGRDWPQRQAVRTPGRTTLRRCRSRGVHAQRDDLLPRKTEILHCFCLPRLPARFER